MFRLVVVGAILCWALTSPAVRSWINNMPQSGSSTQNTAAAPQEQAAVPPPQPRAEQATVGSLTVNCAVTLGNGRTVPVQGWMQLLQGDDILAKTCDIRGTDEYKAGLTAARAGMAYSAKGQIFLAYNHLMRGVSADVVAQGYLSGGKIEFGKLPFGFYFVYGAGTAGLNDVGYIEGPILVERGKSVSVSPEPICNVFCDADAQAVGARPGFWARQLEPVGHAKQ
jgi:hypothetical protein